MESDQYCHQGWIAESRTERSYDWPGGTHTQRHTHKFLKCSPLHSRAAAHCGCISPHITDADTEWAPTTIIYYSPFVMCIERYTPYIFHLLLQKLYIGKSVCGPPVERVFSKSSIFSHTHTQTLLASVWICALSNQGPCRVGSTYSRGENSISIKQPHSHFNKIPSTL